MWHKIRIFNEDIAYRIILEYMKIKIVLIHKNELGKKEKLYLG